MKEHIKRRIENSKLLLPEQSSPDYPKVIELLDKMSKNENHNKMVKERFEKAKNTLKVQDSNGINLNMDQELRYYLNEFNFRSWNHGHRSMPIMFNIMEAFFDLDKKINSWKLLEEEDYLISFYDFLDFYTSETFIFNIDDIKEHFTENIIYNYNVGSEISEITFRTTQGNEFVIAGVSLLRRGNEINMFFLTGEIIDTEKATLGLEKIPKSMSPGKENLTVAENRKREAVKLNNNSNWWKISIVCRFDLENQTTDAKYIAKDEGNSFSIITDDITGFVKNGEWLQPDLKNTYENLLKKIENYQSIFELAKAVIYLPYYFNFFEDKIEEEEHDTHLKEIIKNPIIKRKFNNVDSQYKLRKRSLWILNREERFSAERLIIRDDKFRVEINGYWKKISPDEFGTDKKGNQITGKTWVNKTESYYLANTDELIVTNRKKKRKFETENAGYIYIMRNAQYDKDIYKIGFTTKETEERAKQISKTGVIDQFYVMREWEVKDCKLAEKEIHTALDEYRVDPRREFFKLNMTLGNEIIENIVNKINRS